VISTEEKGGGNRVLFRKGPRAGIRGKRFVFGRKEGNSVDHAGASFASQVKCTKRKEKREKEHHQR